MNVYCCRLLPTHGAVTTPSDIAAVSLTSYKWIRWSDWTVLERAKMIQFLYYLHTVTEEWIHTFPKDIHSECWEKNEYHKIIIDARLLITLHRFVNHSHLMGKPGKLFLSKEITYDILVKSIKWEWKSIKMDVGELKLIEILI